MGTDAMIGTVVRWGQERGLVRAVLMDGHVRRVFVENGDS